MGENLGKIRSQKKFGMKKNSWSSRSSHPIPAAPRIPGIKTRFLRKMGREKTKQTKNPPGFGAFPALWEFPGSAIPKKILLPLFPGRAEIPFSLRKPPPTSPIPRNFPSGIHPLPPWDPSPGVFPEIPKESRSFLGWGEALDPRIFPLHPLLGRGIPDISLTQELSLWNSGNFHSASAASKVS